MTKTPDILFPEEDDILREETQLLADAKAYADTGDSNVVKSLVTAFNTAALAINPDYEVAYTQITGALMLRMAEAHVRLHGAFARKHALLEAMSGADAEDLEVSEYNAHNQHNAADMYIECSANLIATSGEDWWGAENAKGASDFLHAMANMLDENANKDAPVIAKDAQGRARQLITANNDIIKTCRALAALTLFELKIDLGAYGGHDVNFTGDIPVFVDPFVFRTQGVMSQIMRMTMYRAHRTAAEMENEDLVARLRGRTDTPKITVH